MSFYLKIARMAAPAMFSALAAGGAAAADLAPDYVGVDVGVRSAYKVTCWSWSNLACDDKVGGGGRVRAGYTFGSSTLFGMDNSNALELGAFAIGSARSVVPYSADGGYLPGKSRVRGVALSYAPSLKVAQRLSLNGKFGLSMTRTTTAYADSAHLDNYGALPGDSHNRYGLTYGVGLSYALSPNWSLDAGWSRVPVQLGAHEKTRVDSVTVGASYHYK